MNRPNRKARKRLKLEKRHNAILRTERDNLKKQKECNHKDARADLLHRAYGRETLVMQFDFSPEFFINDDFVDRVINERIEILRRSVYNTIYNCRNGTPHVEHKQHTRA